MNPLAAHYSRFRVADRILLTGHSHQAWPDVAFEAQQRAWLDAAEYVDDKWERAAEQAAGVRRGFAALLGDHPDNVALGQNTHELVTRWLSALPLRARPRVVTTDGEFHTIRRQMDRLDEEQLCEIVRIPSHPAETAAERLAAATTDRTAAVLVSSVLYETAEIVPHLSALAARCAHVGAELLVDAYHHLNVVPFDLQALGLGDAFVTGGGYKYCQLGEGNAFLRVPPGRHLRPLLTGWFAEFAALDAGPAGGGRVSYGRGAEAFAGATYDPVSHYRGAAVFAFHAAEGLTPPRLHAINRRQVDRLAGAVERLDIRPDVLHVEPIDPSRRGGFLALRTPHAAAAVSALRARGIFADARGSVLRLGPAPYVDDGQIDKATEAVRDFASSKWKVESKK